MADERNLILGIDLSDVLTQISYYDTEVGEPMPVGYTYTNREINEIPGVLAYDTHHKIWYFGVEAEERKKDSGFITIRNIMHNCSVGATFKIGDTEYSDYDILKIFIIRILDIVKSRFPYNRIQMCAVSFGNLGDVFEAKVKKAFIEAGLEENRFVILKHAVSYMHYATSQKRELWLNNIGLFEFFKDEEQNLRLKFVQLSIDRGTTPFVVSWTERELTENIGLAEYSKLSDYEKINSFTSMANALFYKNSITTVYIVGSRYAAGWIDQSLRKLCVGRRIFKGENLYTRGACYAAYRMLNGVDGLGFVLLDETGINSNIYLRVYSDAEVRLEKIVSAGSKWEETDMSLDIIPDDEDELSVVIENVTTRQRKLHMLSLSNVDRRPNKMTRFTFRIRFSGPNECIITLKDCGFGEFYQSTNRIWERSLKI
ncbi:MAG: hypothetical protein K6G11_05905 [Lachnospiraceae bacterium]|nr:hypothetical protein [Lachnospiraceae bacterium]